MSTRIFLWIFALALAACTGATDTTVDLTAPPAPARPLASAGKYLRDDQGRAVLLRGVNWSGGWKLAPYGRDATEGEIERIAARGWNHVRLLTSWAAIMPEDGRIDRDYLANLRRRAAWAAKHGVWVVADMHQDIYGEGITSKGWPLGNGGPKWTCAAEVTLLDPWMINYIQDDIAGCYDRMYTDAHLVARFAEAHQALLETLGDLPNFLGVELLNEPFIGTASPLAFDRDVLLPFYTQVYARVATAAAGKLIFAEPSIVKNLASLGLLPAMPAPQSVYAPHLYDVSMELGTGYNGDTSYLDFRFDVDPHDAACLGVPVWWGEWGNPPAGDDAARRYIGDFAARADRVYGGWAFWESGLADSRPAVAAALSRAYVEAAPGEPDFAYDPDARRLTATIVGDGAAETWIRAPYGFKPTVRLEGPWAGKAAFSDDGFVRVVLPALPAGATGKAEIRFE